MTIQLVCFKNVTKLHEKRQVYIITHSWYWLFYWSENRTKDESSKKSSATKISLRTPQLLKCILLSYKNNFLSEVTTWSCIHSKCNMSKNLSPKTQSKIPIFFSGWIFSLGIESITNNKIASVKIIIEGSLR